jgi:hypothetical protein
VENLSGERGASFKIATLSIPLLFSLRRMTHVCLQEAQTSNAMPFRTKKSDSAKLSDFSSAPLNGFIR